MRLTKPQKLIYDMEKYAGDTISVICGSIICKGTKTIDELQSAVNQLYIVNDALRIRINENGETVQQEIIDFQRQVFDVLNFSTKEEMNDYAGKYAKEPIDLYGSLCDVKIVVLPNAYGIIVKMHHIIGDAWTLTLLGSQFNEILNGNNVEAYSYREYVDSENKYIQSKRYEKDRTFFLEQFKKCDEATYISEKQIESFSAKRKTFVIDKNNAEKVVNYTNDNNTSVFTLFMTALGVYFSRTHMNNEKFYLGTAVLNRTSFIDKNTAGMFINTVPVLLELQSEQSFRANVENVQNSIFATIRHQKYNYGDVLSDIRKEYDFTEKLYDVMLSYQNAKITGATSEFESNWHHSGCQSESLQIHIDDRDSEGIFQINYDYQIEKFNEEDIDKIHNHIINLLFDGINNDEKLIYSLALLSDDEKNKILNEFNDTYADYPRDKCVHQLFEEQVEKSPNKTAVIACDKTLTYSELNKEANRIAHSLIVKGVRVGDFVAFMLPRKSYLISAILGILKSGAAYLPIDPDYPQDRIDYMLDDSKAKFIITEDNIFDLLNNNKSFNPSVAVSSYDLCYCIYTSGSTGKPKGTLLRHNGIVNLVSDHKIYCELNYESTVGFLTTITFDVASQEIFVSLINGATGVLISERNKTKTEKIIEDIHNNNIDIIYSTPTYFDALTNSVTKSSKLLNSVKEVVLAGESAYINGVVKKYDYKVKFLNHYGPAETHVVSSEIIDFADVTIGKPIANTQIYIVDKYMQPTPIGVTGELCIAGDGVGAGYLNRPELTAEKFIDNPFGKGKLYKTGDLAYWRKDGNIAYVGRNDFQVKIRGLRIELGEIENAISSIDGILQAVVVVRKNDEGRQLICAFYTGKELDAKDIRNVIGTKLPKYMLPHIIIHIDKMPLTSSGKVNRNSLPDVDLYNIDSLVKYVAPTTKEEKNLVEAIENVLNIQNVGILNNFFDLGGDSLKAIELISKLEKLGYHVDTKTIFDCDTVKELAEKLIISKVEEKAYKYDGDIPASNAQMRIYTAQNVNENSTMYNVPYAFKVQNLDKDRLRYAVNSLIARHESLRTHFENKNGEIIQIVDDKAYCEVEQIKNENIFSFIRPFDLSISPLIRVGYFNNTIIIDIHHIVTDGGSMPIIINELNELYMGRELNNQPVQYKQFAIDESYSNEDKEYWLSVFNDEVPVLEINMNFKRGEKQSYKGSTLYDSIDIKLHNRILSFCKEQNITPYVFYMGGFNILLSKFSGNEDVIVGMPISGRNTKYLDTVGMFVNTIALRNQPSGNKTVGEFLQEVKQNSINAIEHQNYPFGELVKELDIQSSNRNPLFDIMFAYQSNEMTDVIFADQESELLPVPVNSSKYDFTFNILPRETDVVVMVEYCMDLYKGKTIQRFIDGYKQILEQLLSDNTKIKKLSAITENENNELLYEFNDTYVEYPRDKCVHQLYEEQVEKSPNKIAVIACDKTLTYSELNEDANRIAHSLVANGIGVGDIVAVSLRRESHLLSAILGVLKASASYMPIDPSYPKNRIDYMLAESKSKYCITEDNISDLLLNSNTKNLHLDYNKNNIFCVLHTSGSTGNPKLSLIKQENILNFISANKRFLKNADTVVSATIVTFDAFQMEVVLSLTQGFKIVLSSEDDIYNQISFEKLFYYSNYNMFFSTPTKLENYIENSLNKAYLEQITSFVVGGEIFNETLLQKIKCFSSKSNVYNIYGPTETTICVTVDKLQIGESITIGKPIANTQIYILDKYMQPTPIGVTGELCIAGDGVGAGYLNRPELTAEKFIDNPFGKGKLYKTGDLAYWREDGNIAYVGRNDFQVKIRGLRIELGEIENVISSIDGILQAVVVVRKNDEGRQLICAFYTGEELDAKDIRNIIGTKLPKYMLPHIIIHIDEMPLTSSGKVNRNALPNVDLENIKLENEYIAPENEQQRAICKLISDVLSVSQVGIQDDFFDIGGDSLKAIELVSKAHTEGIYFSLQNIYDYPTVKKLCEFIADGDKQVVSYDKVNFESINKILAKNKVENVVMPKLNDVGNILLAGATGYLGIHILSDFLDNDNGIAYCLVRGNDLTDSKNRMLDLLNFYFGNKYNNLVDSRIEVVCADLQKEKLNLSNDDYNNLINSVDMVINAAASVKHYGSYKYFYEANVETTKHLIEFCKTSNSKLIHISTLSVSGNGFGDDFDGYVSETEKQFYESNLYIEQPLDNVYARSKFEAEKAVLDAMVDGLQANIMRMGNLTNRTDGKFQRNYESNAFLKRIKGVLDLGVFPDYLMDLYMEFTPIDEAANAIMTIARHFSNNQTVFHINSTKVLYFDKAIEYFNSLDCHLEVIGGTEFTDMLIQSAKDTGTEYIFETFINDMNDDNQLVYDSNIKIENNFTENYLRMLGFEWSNIGLDYIQKYVLYFRKLGYFGE